MDNRQLLDALRAGLPLTPRPFDAIARICDASEVEVLERLGRLRANGTLTSLAPLPLARDTSGAAAAEARLERLDDFDQRLLEVVASGFPLLPHPYEAIAAILGAPEDEVLEHLRALIDAGVIGPIGMEQRATARSRREI